ncbi:hypothetical protein [Pseudomonas sp. HY13-MNA-CIBAN-0226]|uniref:hypothetical protein n=1 Tax=Pseudomonas sp. HY13-MNA-CIBAN-0226 TaxID=3140473 RepID=UPI00333055F5
MAASHFTQYPATTGFHALGILPQCLLQSEKISCSFSPFSGIDPLGLLGRHVEFQHEQEYSVQVVRYGAVVVAFQAAAPGYGIECQLLLRPDDGSDDEYVPISALTVLAVFS